MESWNDIGILTEEREIEVDPTIPAKAMNPDEYREG